MFRSMHTRSLHRNRYSLVLFCLLFSLLATFGAAQAAPQTPTTGPGPVIYVPNDGFAITTLRDSNSYDVLGSVAIPVANTSAINHSADGSLLYSVSRGLDETFNLVDQFSVIDVTTQSLLGSVDLPFRGLSNCTASTVVALPDNSKAYVACEGNGFVEVIHMNLPLGQVTLGTPIYTGWPKSAQFVNGSVYVSNTQSNTITRIDPLTDLTEVVVNAHPFIIQDAVVDPFRPYAYIVHIFNNRILIGSTTTHDIVRTLDFAGQPIDLLLAPDGERLYVTVDNGEGNGQDHIAVVEGLGSVETIVAMIPVGEAATYLASNDEGSCVFAWDFVNSSRRIDVIDTATAQLSAQPVVSGGDADGDFVGPGAVSLAVYFEPGSDNQNTFTVGEGAGSIQLLVRRGCSSQGTVQVNYATQTASNGYDAAVAGEDFQAVNGTLIFAEGELTKIVEIPLINDELYGEPTRSFALVLSDPSGALLGSRFVDTVNVVDDDPIPASSDLQLYLSDNPSPVTAGEELVYSINLSNYPSNGGGAAEDVIVTDQLPAGVTFVSAEMTINQGGGGGGDGFSAASIDTLPQPGTCDTPAVGAGGTVTCNVGTLNPAYEGVSADITIRVQVLETAADSDLLNSASVTSSSFDLYPDNNSASVTTHVDAPVNNLPPRITIVLDSQPERNLNVRFDGTAPIGRFRLDDITPQDADSVGNSQSFTLEAGSYVVTQRVRNGWFLTDIACDTMANTVTDLANKQVTFNVVNGDDVTCTFVNQKAGIIRATLFHDRNGNGTRQGREPFNVGWTVNLLDDQNVQIATQTTNNNGKVSFTNLRPGDYTVCEVLQNGLSNPQPCRPLQIAPHQIAQLTFANVTGAGVMGAALDNNTLFSVGSPDSSSEEDEDAEEVAPNDDAWLQSADAAMDHILFLSVVRR